jgi:TonB family protein
MRICALRLAGGLAAAALASSAIADPARPPSPSPNAATIGVNDPTASYYPLAALRSGVDGAAVIRCARNAHLAVRDCTLVSETPAGQGFGAAALAMAAKSADNPKVDDAQAAARPPADIEVRFSAHAAPAVQPDLTSIAHLFGKPTIIAQPTDAQVQAAYPARALSDQIRGGAAIDCIVTITGALSSCHVSGEAPVGYGFGQAALDLAADYKLRPRTLDGEPVGGAQVRITVGFAPNDPSAPLTLGVKPAP